MIDTGIDGRSSYCCLIPCSSIHHNLSEPALHGSSSTQRPFLVRIACRWQHTKQQYVQMTGYAQWVAVHMLFIACVLFRRWACGHSRCRAAAFTALAFLAVLVSQVRIFTKAGALDAEIVPHSALDYLLASVSSCEQWATWAADGILVLIFLWYGSCEPTPAGGPKAVRTPGHKLHRCLMIVITFTSTVAAARILCDGSANRCCFGEKCSC